MPDPRPTLHDRQSKPSFLSLIIPVLNEERQLARTLNALAPLVSSPARLEVIVVDGGSQDQTLEIARSYGWAKTIAYGRACRALQMNAGARAARGTVLLFLHADVTLSAKAVEAVSRALEDQRVAGGCFEISFPADAPGSLRLMAAGINLRTRLFRTATGDQAIFVRRTVFDEFGGYHDIPLMEDLELFAAIKRRGHAAILSGPVEVSPRRWLKRGVWRTMLLMYALRFGYWAGLSPTSLKKFFTDVR